MKDNIMEDLIKELNNLRPTEEQVKDKPAYYAFGYVDAINTAIQLVKNLGICSVSQKRELLRDFLDKMEDEGYLNWHNHSASELIIIYESL